MEYERIHQVQTGIISPSKLRMKLMGPHHSRKKNGPNSNSSRTSPSRLEDAEFVNNSLLASCEEEVAASSLELPSASQPGDPVADLRQFDQILPEENGLMGRRKMQQCLKGEIGNLSAVHPIRSLEDGNHLDYDSNASSSSFEFHKERSASNQFTRSFSRPMSSKWNDAEKWIMNRQNLPSNKNAFHNQVNRISVNNTLRVAPEPANHDLKLSHGRMVDINRMDSCQPVSQMNLEKFSFIPPGIPAFSDQEQEGNVLIDQFTQCKDSEDVDQTELAIARSSLQDPTVCPVIRSVCMRDMGTEMTPVTSQEPSRTATPLGATTPLRHSPTSSIPSTPRRPAPAPTPMDHGTDDDDTKGNHGNGKKELTEKELKLKTRQEIVALGVKLGKMNIAAWASNSDQEKNLASAETLSSKELEKAEFEKRAFAWEEAEKSKHNSRYNREEIKLQAWESRQKAKLEAETKRVEARLEQIRAQAEAKMVKKIAMARQKSEEKRAAAESRRNKDAERSGAQAEYIRQTGRMPSSRYVCCGWL